MKSSESYRLSPNYSVLPGYDGSPIVAEQVHPYRQFRLSEDLCILACHFLPAGGTTVEDATNSFLKHRGGEGTPDTLEQVYASLRQLVAQGVLVVPGGDLSIYQRKIALQYHHHRPVPEAIANMIVEAAKLDNTTRVLDLATGTGSLAIQLAAHSDHVTGMDISRGFLEVAERSARRWGLPLKLLHDSCNRLIYHEAVYDVITISQAMHWLDTPTLCRGIHRVLAPGGRLFCVDGQFYFPKGHPLRRMDVSSRTEPQATAQFFEQKVAHIETLLSATAPPEPAHTIVRDGIWSFRQRRPFGLGFADAFFTEDHIRRLGKRRTWANVRAQLAERSGAELMGFDYWIISCFQKGPTAEVSPQHGFQDIEWRRTNHRAASRPSPAAKCRSIG